MEYRSIIEESELFDEFFYMASYREARVSDELPLDHFIKYGLKEDRKPNEWFDPVWYREYYEDIKETRVIPFVHYLTEGLKEFRFANENEKKEYELLQDSFNPVAYRDSYEDLQKMEDDFDFILHYIRFGKQEGREARYVSSSSEISKPPLEVEDEKNIIESCLFDINYYLGSYPDVKFSQQDPIKHYCNFGWQEDRNPNRDFNTKYYKTKYSDVAQAGINPFVHWLLYGKNENRFINSVEVEAFESQHNNCPSIIFISHEASQTGAPAVLLSFMQWIKNNTDINFSIIVGASGPWNSKFESLASTFFMDENHKNGMDTALRKFCGNQVQTIYINTIASALYAEQLKFLNAEYITHVHEMENVFQIFKPHVDVLQKICNKYIAVSQGSVDALKKRFSENEISIKFLKPFIDRKKENSALVSKPTTKKVIFGCGAVEMRKGFDIFCIVASMLKDKGRDDFKFYWIGSDEEKDLVANEVISQQNVNDMVEFMGSKEYPRDFFEWGDIFLLPSREDPYPLACMEAAECKMPVICFDEQAGGMHSFVENDAGAVVPYLNMEAMAEEIESLLDNEKKRKRFGEIAHRKVKERHYVDVIASQILEFLPTSIQQSAYTEIEGYFKHIENADAVSFDIFDTLVTRRLSNPEVVFDVIEYRHTQSEVAPLPLFNERMQTAGKVLGSYHGKKDDVNIDEIYENMSFYKNSTIEKQTEIEMCVALPIGKKLYDYAKKLNKYIVITSDMYLDKATVKQILKKSGFSNWNAFYLSSEQGKKKDTGNLFELLKKDLNQIGIPTDKIVHIGDNWNGDVKFARIAGLNAVRFAPLYESNHKLIRLNTKQETQLSQIGKIWNSFTTQSTRLWREKNPEASQDIYVRLGFELTGPLATMMAMHTRILADEVGAKKIVFMARDGRIIKKAFDSIYTQEIENGKYILDYLHLSRATVIPATFEHPLSSNDIYFLIEGLHLHQKPLSYFLQKANLDTKDKNIIKKIKRYFDSLDIIPHWDDLNQLSKMFTELSADIYEANEDNRKALKHYLQEHGVFNENAIVFVDVGWMLNIQSRLDKFIKIINPSAKLIGSYVGSRERINKSITHSSLLFDNGDPFVYANFIEENVTLFEILFSSPEPSAHSLKIVDERVEVQYKELDKPIPSNEFIVAQKLHFGAEAYFKELASAKKDFFPEQISKDYFFKIFEALVQSDSDLLKATLGHFEVRLGGHHEFVTYQELIKNDTFFEYRLKAKDEYFNPLSFEAKNANEYVTIVTSAGLDNGSTKYRAINLAESLKKKGINATLIHAATPLDTAETLIRQSSNIIFQRCFEEQGNVGEFLALANKHAVKTIAETDDLVFPHYVTEIGSVKGGEWNLDEAKFVASSYEKLIKKVQACIVSTPTIKEFIETTYHIPTVVIRNKVSPSMLKEPVLDEKRQIKLIYASGTYSHKEDFELIEEVLYTFMLKHPDITLSILGAAQVSERILALSNVSNYPLLPYEAMLGFVSQHDLMLVPLVDDIFNRAKSNVKFVECGAVGVPVLASNVGEFARTIKHRKNGLLAATADEFYTLIEQSTQNKELLRELAYNAYASVVDNYTTDTLEQETFQYTKKG